MGRKIPASGINLFQLIYILIREYTEKTGLPPLNLSLGNPDGVPNQELLALEGQYATDPSFELHTYAEDTNLKHFAEGMVRLHGGIEVAILKLFPFLVLKVQPPCFLWPVVFTFRMPADVDNSFLHRTSPLMM